MVANLEWRSVMGKRDQYMVEHGGDQTEILIGTFSYVAKILTCGVIVSTIIRANPMGVGLRRTKKIQYYFFKTFLHTISI
jgi:hypothetical protein